MTEAFTPKERSAVESIIGNVEGARNAMVFSQTLLKISKDFRKLNLQEIEELLRKRKSGTYLFGLPVSTVPECDAMWPHAGKTTFPYYLWVEVNGERKARELMEDNSIDSSINFERLPHTGMLTPKPNRDISQTVASPFN